MPRIFEAAKDIALLSPVIIGTYLGATALAEQQDEGYSHEKIEEASTAIAGVDEKIRMVIGEENQCQIHIYDFLRPDEAFPTRRDEIQDTLSKTCPDLSGQQDDTYRLIESHVGDLVDMRSVIADQDDKRFVSGFERFGFGYVGFGAGLLASWGLARASGAVAKRYNNSSSEQE